MSANEEWRIVTDRPHYAVSSLGRVKRVVPGARNHTCRVLAPYRNNKGYLCVDLATGGRRVRRLVNRLVCTAFHGPAPFEGADAAHGDGNPLNNVPTNLRWASRAENMADAQRHGTIARGATHGRHTKPERTPRGESHGHAKLTEEIVRAIRSAPRINGSGRALARIHNISPATVSLIRSRKIWSHA